MALDRKGLTMPAYYMIGNPTIREKIYKRGSIHNLDKLLSSAKIKLLIKAGVVRLLDKTGEVGLFPPLEEYVTILKESGIETLGDFAVADPSELSDIPDVEVLQEIALAAINPDNARSMDECCGQSPLPFPIA